MAFNNLQNLDTSDLNLWATCPACDQFVEELQQLKAKALRCLINNGADEHEKFAQEYKAFEKVLGLIEEAREIE